MNVKDVQEDADAHAWPSIEPGAGNIGDFSVSGGNDQPRAIGYPSLRIAEKPKKKGREQHGNHGPDRGSQPYQNPGYKAHAEGIEDTVADHPNDYILSASPAVVPRPWWPDASASGFLRSKLCLL